MMNNDNRISTKTKLFGFIGEHAGASRFSAIMNKKFKQNGDDTMIIPMNIREDDLFFTLSNMKNSHVNGAVISSEYVSQTPEILDDASSLVKRSGMCDIVYKENNTLRGDLFSVRVLSEHLKDLYLTKLAIIGTNHYAKAFAFLSCGFNVSYFNENLEELMQFSKDTDQNNNIDMNRIAEDMQIDLSDFDAVIDCSDFASLAMVTGLAKYNFDMKNSKQFSALKQRSLELQTSYTGYDDLLEALSDKVYQLIH